MSQEFVLVSAEAPTANGRLPAVGDVQYRFTIPLDDGRILALLMGVVGRNALREMLYFEEVDDVVESIL